MKKHQGISLWTLVVEEDMIYVRGVDGGGWLGLRC